MVHKVFINTNQPGGKTVISLIPTGSADSWSTRTNGLSGGEGGRIGRVIRYFGMGGGGGLVEV